MAVSTCVVLCYDLKGHIKFDNSEWRMTLTKEFFGIITIGLCSVKKVMFTKKGVDAKTKLCMENWYWIFLCQNCFLNFKIRLVFETF
jgi:hypothetical protein